MTGGTVKFTPALATPFTVTTRLPLVPGVGTVTVRLVLLQLLAAAAAPLKVTVLEPCVAPKLVPTMVTDVPTTPLLGVTLVMPGATVKLTGVLETPSTVITIGADPAGRVLGTGTTIVVPFQLLGVAAVPPNVNVLLPWLAPKSVPVMVIAVPADARLGDTALIPGTTVKDAVLLAIPFTVTTMFAVPAGKLLGTATTML